jgi:hypothetical protein
MLHILHTQLTHHGDIMPANHAATVPTPLQRIFMKISYWGIYVEQCGAIIILFI